MTKTGRKAVLLSAFALVVLAVVLAWVNWGWVVFVREFEWLGRNAQNYREYRHRKTGIVFVRLPGGTFNMGSPKEELDHWASEGPVRSVKLSPFLIAKFEVSQAEWRMVMRWNRSRFIGENRPVENVSWNDCKRFCAHTGLSLPTEAQWEYACRAGTATPFAFGETLTKEQANYAAFGGQETVEVDSFKPNGFGLHNMHGNVSEWCEDVYDSQFYKRPEASAKNPVCASGRGYRVVRGGCWDYHAGYCRSACRHEYYRLDRVDLVGFRPVAPAP